MEEKLNKYETSLNKKFLSILLKINKQLQQVIEADQNKSVDQF